MVLETRIFDLLKVGVEIVFLLFRECRLTLRVTLLFEHAVELDGLLPLLLPRLRHRRQVLLRYLISTRLLKLGVTLDDSSIDAEAVR